jgi:hypothetical protein
MADTASNFKRKTTVGSCEIKQNKITLQYKSTLFSSGQRCKKPCPSIAFIHFRKDCSLFWSIVTFRTPNKEQLEAGGYLWLLWAISGS